MSFSKIIVGIDFTPKSERAMRAAINIAAASKATVVLLNVVPSLAAMRGEGEDEVSVTQAIERRLRDQAAILGTNTGVTIDYGVVDGPRADEAIVKYVKRWGGDLIVTGTDTRSGLDRILIGSVTEALLQNAPVPVLVVGPKVA